MKQFTLVIINRPVFVDISCFLLFGLAVFLYMDEVQIGNYNFYHVLFVGIISNILDSHVRYYIFCRIHASSVVH